MLETMGYVVLDTVRAGMVKNAADWSRIAYRASVGLEHRHLCSACMVCRRNFPNDVAWHHSVM